ncbi:hypothetical protein NQZ68_029311 [Dissostichus eleginoides]|nr:hypothetical protein NQZ68_029311 [Dissostichus eleginoides]
MGTPKLLYSDIDPAPLTAPVPCEASQDTDWSFVSALWFPKLTATSGEQWGPARTLPGPCQDPFPAPQHFASESVFISQNESSPSSDEITAFTSEYSLWGSVSSLPPPYKPHSPAHKQSHCTLPRLVLNKSRVIIHTPTDATEVWQHGRLHVSDVLCGGSDCRDSDCRAAVALLPVHRTNPARCQRALAGSRSRSDSSHLTLCPLTLLESNQSRAGQHPISHQWRGYLLALVQKALRSISKPCGTETLQAEN